MYENPTPRTGTIRVAVGVGVLLLVAAIFWALVTCTGPRKAGTGQGAGTSVTATTPNSGAATTGGTDADNTGQAGGGDSGATPGGTTTGTTTTGTTTTGTATATPTSAPGTVTPTLIKPSIPPLISPSAEDCVGYNPANLTVQNAGAVGWRVVDGSHAMLVFDTESDAIDGVRVARGWRQMCFIGRANTRPDRYRYISYYWKTPSGLPVGLAPHLDCVSYNPAKLAIRNNGAIGWTLVDDEQSLLLLDTAGDAGRARLVAAGSSQLCFIGRGNSRPDRYRYIVEYWRS